MPHGSGLLHSISIIAIPLMLQLISAHICLVRPPAYVSHIALLFAMLNGHAGHAPITIGREHSFYEPGDEQPSAGVSPS